MIFERKKSIHAIDTCVFLENTLDTHLGNICTKHLVNMGKGKYYNGVLSVSVLGEIVMIIQRDIQDPLERIDKLRYLEELIRRRNISFVTPRREDHLLIDRLMDIERGLEELDALHLVSAKRANAEVFLTFDKALLSTEAKNNLEKMLNLKIEHPIEFI